MCVCICTNSTSFLTNSYPVVQIDVTKIFKGSPSYVINPEAKMPNSTFTTPMSKATLTKSLIVLAQKMRSESIYII